MVNRLKKNMKALLKYRKAMKGIDPFLCFVDRLLNREVERLLVVCGVHVWVRTNSPDINAAISSLCENEYDHIRCLSPNVIIDAGANIGTSSIYFATKYPSARVFAIEPEESNFKLLIKNTGKYTNIVPIRAALWGSTERRQVQNRFTGHWGYTVSDTTNKVESTGQEIECITIENIIKKYGIESIDLIKMDIEGGEKNVLENSNGWIDLVGTMTVELHDKICMGCSRAFYLATKDFKVFERHSDKVTAYRD